MRAAVSACVLIGASQLVPAAAATPKEVVVTAKAGSVARVRLTTFLPMSGRRSIDVVGAHGTDVGGAALIGSDKGLTVSGLKTPCHFAGPCTHIPFTTSYGTAAAGKENGLSPGSYDLVILGRPSSTVTLRLRNSLAIRSLRFRPGARITTVELPQRYPSTAEQMPEAYFDQQMEGPSGTNVTVLIGQLDASRPKTLQFASCIRHGPVPVVQVPRYGQACVGEDTADGQASSAGAVSVGGDDCETVKPACVPLTASSVRLSFAAGVVFSAPPRVSFTSDILATKSHVRATALTFVVS